MVTAELDHSCRRLTQALRRRTGSQGKHTNIYMRGKECMQKHTHARARVQAHLMLFHMACVTLNVLPALAKPILDTA